MVDVSNVCMKTTSVYILDVVVNCCFDRSCHHSDYTKPMVRPGHKHDVDDSIISQGALVVAAVRVVGRMGKTQRLQLGWTRLVKGAVECIELCTGDAMGKKGGKLSPVC